jgi:hypothetical protein
MSCTVMGAWGPATPEGSLVQLRALDFGTVRLVMVMMMVLIMIMIMMMTCRLPLFGPPQGPFANGSMLVVYHSSDSWLFAANMWMTMTMTVMIMMTGRCSG